MSNKYYSKATRHMAHLHGATYTHSDRLREADGERLSNEAVSGGPRRHGRRFLNLSDAVDSFGLWLKALGQPSQTR